MRGVVAILLLVCPAVVGRPITSSEKDAVGTALSNALGVMSGKMHAGSKYASCAEYFSDGPPKNPKKDVMWQSCKGVLGENFGKKKAMLLKTAAKRPITSSEKDAVGAALTNALGVMSGKVHSGSKYTTCLEYFSDGPPKNPKKDVMWQSCKGVLGENFGKKKAMLLKTAAKRPITSSEKDAVGAALTNALGVMSGKVHSGSKYTTCLEYFSDGPPANPKKDVMWQSCKSVLGDNFGKKKGKKAAALLTWPRYANVDTSGITEDQKEQVKEALSDALGSLAGNKNEGATKEAQMCMDEFRNGPPHDLFSPQWLACKDQLPSSFFGSATSKMIAAMSGAGGHHAHHHR